MSFVKFNPNPKRGQHADCCVRALCAATDMTWQDAYDALCAAGREVNDMPNTNNAMHVVLTRMGFKKFTCLAEKGKRRMCVNALARTNDPCRIVASCANHMVGIADGDYKDTWDCGEKCVYTYWINESTQS